MSQKENEHFASMRRTTSENVTFALMAALATAATTLLAVGPAQAGGDIDARVAAIVAQQQS